MFGLPRQGISTPEDRTEVIEYLREVLPLEEKLDKEFQDWIETATEDATTLTIAGDPDGQHAAVYLWRVGQTATDFTQTPPARAAKRYHENYALCLEARGAAADYFKEAADLALIKDPSARIADANKRLLEAQRYRNRAKLALQRLHTSLGAP